MLTPLAAAIDQRIPFGGTLKLFLQPEQLPNLQIGVCF